MNTKENGTQASKKLVALLAILALVGSLLMPVSTQAISKPTQVKSLKVTAQTTSSIKVSWKKVKNAKGYQIYRSTSKNGKYSKVKTIKSGKTVSWTNKSLKAGKKYYYKVRAYKTYKKKGKTKYLYGKYSTKKAVSTKIKLSKTSMTLTAGGSAKLTATSSTSVSWSTSNSKVARYNKSAGKVIAVSAGSATITAKASSGASASCRVFVREAAPSDPTPTPAPTPVPTPTEPTVTTYLKILDASGNEVTELQAGNTYTLSCSGSWYRSLDGTMSTSADNEAAAYMALTPVRATSGYKATVTPIVAGEVYIVCNDGMKKKFTITKGATITTGGKTIELGGAVPSGYSESYATIYGNTQYVYNKDTENLVLVGAENGKAKTVFTMGSYSMDTEEDYLKISETGFGGTTIQPIRYMENMILNQTLNTSDSLLENEATVASIVASAVRVKEGGSAVSVNSNLSKGAREQSERVAAYTGSSSDWHYLGGNPGTRYGALGISGSTENITSGGMGSNHCVAVESIDGFYNSSGHRANLLDSTHSIIGTGIVYKGADSFAITQAYAPAQ